MAHTKGIDIRELEHTTTISPDKYWADEDQWDQGGSFTYRFDRNPKGAWVMIDYAGGSDYSGQLIQVSNYRVLLKEADKLAAKHPDKPAFHITFRGGYSTFAIAFHVERTPGEIREMLAGLENYPLLDEDDHSQLETEKTEEAWESWARRDFHKELAKKFGDDATELLDDNKLDVLFQDGMEKANVYWENESADNMCIDLERIVKAITTLD